MKAWLLDHVGDGVKGLRIGTVTDPVPEPGEAVLEVTYAALNPADRYLAEGQYPARPALPHILGRDGIGTVVEVGADVRTSAPATSGSSSAARSASAGRARSPSGWRSRSNRSSPAPDGWTESRPAAPRWFT